MAAKRNYYLLICFWGILLNAEAQISVYNKGVQITNNGVNIYINGHYVNLTDSLNSNLQGGIANSGNIYVSGNMVHQTSNGLFISNTGTLTLNGSGNQSFSGSGNINFFNLTLHKPAGSLVLSKPLTINSNLTFTQGFLDLNNQSVNLGFNGQIVNESEHKRIFNVGQVNATRFLNGPNPATNIAGMGLHLGSGQNLGTTQIVRKHTVEPNVTNQSINQTFTLTTGLAATVNDIKFRYFTADLNSLNPSNLGLWRSENQGLQWFDISAVAGTNEVNGSALNLNPMATIITAADKECNDTLPGYLPAQTLVCGGQETVINPNAPGLIYHWNTGATSAFIATNTAGNYAVTISDLAGCKKILTTTVVEQAKPIAAISTSNNCLGVENSFISNSSIGAGSITQYHWDFGVNSSNLDTSLSENPTFIYPQAGVFRPRLITTSDFGCKDTAQVQVIIFPNPEADFNVSDICLGQQAVFSNASTISSGGMLYNWQFGDASSSTSPTPNHLYTNSGAFEVTLAARSNAGCTDTVRKTINVYEIPQAIFTATASCSNIPLHINNQTSITNGTPTYQWSFGDNTTSSDFVPVKTYANGGNYEIVLTAINVLQQCSTADTVSVLVESAPNASFTANNVCLGDSIQINNTSSSAFSVNYHWTFGTGSSTLTQPTIGFAQHGIYDIRLVASSNNGCTDTLSRQVQVFAVPNAAFNIQDSCLGNDLQLQNLSNVAQGTIQYAWDFGDGSSSVDFEPSKTYQLAVSRNISLIATADFGCADTLVKAYNPVNLPAANLPDSLNFCGNEFEYTFNSIGNTVVWSNGDTGNLLTAQTTGWYGLTVTNALGCVNTDSMYVTLNALPTFNLGTDTTICSELSLVVNQAGNVIWNTGSTQHTLSVANSGLFIAQLTDDNGCQFTDSINITYAGLELSVDTSLIWICENETAVLTEGTPNLSYHWSTGDTTLEISTQQAGNYQLRAENASGCRDTALFIVNLLNTPQADFSVGSICQGSLTTFQNLTQYPDETLAYNWFINGNQSGSSTNLQHTFNQLGNTNILLIATSNNGCTDSVSKVVTVNFSPVANFSATSVCQLEQLNVTDASIVDANTTYLWNFQQASSSLSNPLFTANQSGNHVVTLSLTTDSGCVSTSSQNVAVFARPQINLSDSLIACGESLSAVASADMSVQWLWNAGENTNSITASTQGVYSVSATSSQGCSSADSIFIQPLGLPQLTLSDNVDSCVTEVILSAFSSGAIAWNNGDTTTNILVNQSGIYIATASNSAGCTLSDTVTVNLRAIPQITLPSDDTLCAGLQKMAVAGPLGQQYQWNDGSALRARNFSQSGTYNVTATNSQGCVATDSFHLVFLPTPTANFTFSGNCSGYPTLTNNTSSISAGNLAYLWQFDQGSSTAVSPSMLFNQSGTYGITLIASSDFGCADTLIRNIVINPTPIASFLANEACLGSPTTFQNTSVGTGSLGFSWRFGDGTTSTQPSPNKTYANTGNYQVRLIANASNGCRDTVFNQINVNGLPSITPSGNITTCGDSIILTAATANYDYAWNTGDTTAQLVASSNGNYTVTATNAQGCISTANYTVVLNSTPTLNLGADTAHCGPYLLKSGITSAQYLWNTGANSAEILVSNSGVYSLTTTDANGCIAADSISISILPTPTAKLGNDTTFCFTSVGLNVGQDNAGDQYSWNTGDTTATINVLQSGTYLVTVSTVDGCSAQDSIVVVVNEVPQVAFSAADACFGDSISFINNSIVQSTTTYQWNMGNGDVKSEASFNYLYPQVGIYTVSLTATTQAGCSEQAVSQVEIFETPTANFSFNSICEGDTALFVNSSTLLAGTANYNWLLNNQSIATTADLSYHFTQASTTLLSLVVTSNQGCADTASQAITVHPNPTLSLSADVDTCASTTTLFANAAASSLLWSNGSSSSSIQVNNSGTYHVTATTQAGCESADSVLVNLRPILNVNGSNPTTINTSACDSLLIGYQAIAGVNYTWSTGDTSAQIMVSQTGNYNWIAVNGFGCSDSGLFLVSISNTPQFNLPNDTAICSGSPYFLSANAGNVNYLWNNGSASPQQLITQAGSYTVTATNAQGCASADTFNLTYLPLPTASFSASNLCLNDSVRFTNSSTANGPLTFIWSFGNGQSSALENPAMQYNFSGNYSVVLQATDSNGCFNSAQQNINVRPAPTASFTATNRCEGQAINFINTSSISTGTLNYLWDFDNGNSATMANPQQVFTTAGTYSVQLTATSAFGCSDSSTLNVQVFGLPIITLPANATTCNDTLTLNAGNAGSNFQWSNFVFTQQNTVSQSGSYTVTVTNSNNCSATATTTVQFNNQYAPILPASIANCDSVIVDAGNTAFSFNWSNGATTSSQTVYSSGNYVVSITDANGCLSLDSVLVTVNASPVVALGTDTAFCSPDTLVLDAGFSGSTYQWSTGENSQQITASSTANYFVTVTTPAGCFGIDNRQITIQPQPLFSLGPDTTTCDSISLEISAIAPQYTWFNGNTASIISITQSANVYATATSAFGCSFSDTVNVVVLNSEPFSLGVDTGICNGNSLTLSAIVAGSTYNWSTGSTDSAIVANSAKRIWLERTLPNGCINTDTLNLDVFALPEATLQPDYLLCTGQTVTLNTGNLNTTHTWFADTGTGVVLLPTTTNTLLVADSGLYWVEMTNAEGCFNTDTSLVFLADNFITADFLSVSESFVGDTIAFISISFPQTLPHSWTFGDGVVSSQIDPLHPYFLVDTFNVRLIVGSSFCADTVEKPIVVKNRLNRAIANMADFNPIYDPFISAKFYPNPVHYSGTLDLILHDEFEVLGSLFNTNGQLLQEIRLNGKEIIYQLPTDRLTPGIYILKLQIENTQKTIKIIKY